VETLRHPIGELPPEVYWRRRLVAGAFLLLAILVVFFLIKAASAGPPKTPGPGVSETPSVTTTPSPAVTGVRACGVADLIIDLAPTTRDFASPTSPTFHATVTQKGLTACVLDPAVTGTELLVTSGSDRIWSNLDCAQPLLSGTPVALSPNQTADLTAEWPRIRSNPSCGTGLATPLHGTYHATLTIDGVTSTTATFTLSG